MNPKKNNQEFSNDRLLNEDVMKLAADMIQTDIDMEMLAYEQREVPIREEFDEKMLMTVRKIDAERSQKGKKEVFKRMSRFVAVFLVCIISLGVVTMGTSEAFRKKVIDIFYNDSAGSIALRNGNEEELIGDWEDFWYPAYLPEGFFLNTAESGDHFLLYSNPGKGMDFYIFEQDKNASLSVDTDYTQIEKTQIGYSDGYIFARKDVEGFKVTWRTENHSMMACFDGAWDKSQVLEIIDGLEYVESLECGN